MNKSLLSLYRSSSTTTLSPLRRLALNKKFLSTSATAAQSTSTNATVGPAGSVHWKYERIATIALIPFCVYPIFTGPSGLADAALNVLLPLHCHWGLEQIVTDYLNKRKIGVAHYGVMGLLYLSTALSAYGLYRFNTSDIGITEFVRNLWTAKKSVAAKN